MAKSKDYTPFPATVCEYIRNCIRERNKAENKRKKLFENRDAALEQLRTTPDSNKARRAELEADYGRAVLEIAGLAKVITWLNNQIEDAVNKADEPGLWQSAEVEIPNFNREESGDEGEGDTRPVGRPRKAAAPRAEDAPPPPEGQDQHLAADVNELDLREDLKGKLKMANLATVGAVNKAALDHETGKVDLTDLLQADARTVKAIVAAVKKYISLHRRADREATSEPIKFPGRR